MGAPIEKERKAGRLHCDEPRYTVRTSLYRLYMPLANNLFSSGVCSIIKGYYIDQLSNDYFSKSYIPRATSNPID